MNVSKSVHFLFLLFLPAAIIPNTLHAQTDTVSKKQIIILHSQRLNYQRTDSAEFQSVVGEALLKQENALFSADSILLNKTKNILEGFGHVHINDADSVNIYSDYVKYTGNDKKAYLKGNVSLSDGKATLTSPDLNYDLNTKIGIYTNGGKVISGTSVLISKEGYYFGETRDVHFNKNVLLIDTNYTVKTADSLYYNTNTQIATFVSPTEIASGKRSKVLTDSGYYDTKNKRSYFTKRSTIQDSTTFITADEIANDEISGFGEASGNVIYEDTAQHVKIYSDNLKSNRNNSSFLATIHPVMMIRQEQDSVYIAADTLFSAKLSDLRQSRTVADISNAGETKKNAMHTSGSNDSMHLLKPVTKDTLSLAGSTKSKDSLQQADTALLVENNAITTDSVFHKKIFVKDSATTKDSSTNRYFEAYYHVRIFSDSLQSVCDSLFYSEEDSAFRLYKNPVVWSQESQITGDTIYLYTQNEKPKRLYAFENGFIIQKVAPEFFNQVKGRTVNAYFKDGNIDYVRAKGNSESIYYAQDDSSKFVEANKATADIIDMYFENKKPQRVIFRVNLVGTSYPMRQLPDDMKLRSFNWQEAIRPKTKEELFYKNIIPKK